MPGPADIPILSPARGRWPAADLPGAVAGALRRLGEAPGGAGRARRLTIQVNDPQRHTDSASVLRALAAAMDLSRSRLLVATGTHSFSASQRGVYARRLAAALPCADIAWHDCRWGGLVPIGGAEGWLGHPWLLGADAVLAIGSVEPHYFAGFTGAHKTATVGCASHRDVESNHARAVDPACRPCRLEGNPVFQALQDLVAALEGCRPVAAVNLVQRGRRVLAARGGGLLDCLRAAAPPAERAFLCAIDRPLDGLVAEVSGPLGGSFYQADKGIKNSEWAVRDGGALVLVAPCPDGIGQEDFLSLLAEGATHRQAAEVVRRRGYRLGDHKALRLRYLTDPAVRGVRLFVVSEHLSQEQARLLGAAKAADAISALRQAGIDPARDRVRRLGDAGNACAILRAPAPSGR